MAKDLDNTGISHNALAFGSKIKGDIISDSDFRIDGEVEGTIDCSGRLVIGPKGKLLGNARCANAEIMGELRGNVIILDTLSLKSTARIYGDIKTKILMIEPSAIFCGTCDMSEEIKKTDVNKEVKK